MIYFVRAGNGLIKIGTTSNIKTRLCTLGSTLKGQLALLATMPGSFAEEHEIHERFDHLRIRGSGNPELFRPESDLLDFIQRMRETHDQEAERQSNLRVNLEIDPTLVRKLRFRGIEINKTVSQMIVEALERYLADDPLPIAMTLSVHIDDIGDAQAIGEVIQQAIARERKNLTSAEREGSQQAAAFEREYLALAEEPL